MTICRDMETKWQAYELDLERMNEQRRGLSEQIGKLTNANEINLAYEMIDSITKAEREVIHLQQVAEEYLIENECEGWTST